MAGLMNAAPGQRPGIGPPPSQQAAPPTRDGSPLPNVTPEEQAQYDAVVDNALRLIYGDKAFPRVMEILQAAPEVTTGIANVAATTFLRLGESMMQNQVQVEDGVLLAAAGEVVADLAELVEKAGIAPEVPDDQVEVAFYEAVDMYRQFKQSAGQIDPARAEQTLMSALEADRQGMLQMPGDEPAPSSGPPPAEQRGAPPPRPGEGRPGEGAAQRPGKRRRPRRRARGRNGNQGG